MIVSTFIDNAIMDSTFPKTTQAGILVTGVNYNCDQGKVKLKQLSFNSKLSLLYLYWFGFVMILSKCTFISEMPCA